MHRLSTQQKKHFKVIKNSPLLVIFVPLQNFFRDNFFPEARGGRNGDKLLKEIFTSLAFIHFSSAFAFIHFSHETLHLKMLEKM